jgi:hypothetical protein
MSDDLEKTLYTTHRTIQDKHVYFLLAAAGAGIGFALTQTTGQSLHWSQVSLGLALICWGVSFYCGCRQVDAAGSTVSLNLELMKIRAGVHPLSGASPPHMKLGEELTLETIEKHRTAGGRAFRWQFRLLLLGAFLYVIWQLTEMYLRTPGATQSLPSWLRSIPIAPAPSQS